MPIISLPKIPKDEFYEDWVAATLCVGGYYVDRRINLTKPTNILELDVVTSRFAHNTIAKTIVEIKSGSSWGFPDIFKVRGWMDYLNVEKGAFIALNTDKQDFNCIQSEVSKLNMLLSNIDINETSVDADDFIAKWELPDIATKQNQCAINTLRYAFWLERQLFDKYTLPMARGKNPQKDASLIKDSIMDVNVHSFFIADPYARLHHIFKSFINYRNLTSRVDSHRNGGDIDNVDNNISRLSFERLYYSIEAKKDLLHVSLYSELICRLTVLKLCIEEIIKCDSLADFLQWIEKESLPSKNIREGIEQLQKHEYYYLYPHFWQIFIFVFGGFILMSKKDEEYTLLSELTSIPIDEIDNALSAFDILFPIQDKSWLFDRPHTCIRILRFMPLPISGLGANYRRNIYSCGDDKRDYNYLETLLPKDYTCADLIKFNNLAVAYF